MKQLKIVLLAGILLASSLFCANPVLAVQDSISAVASLYASNRIEQSDEQSLVILPFEQDACDRFLACSHPEDLYRGGGFVALTAGNQWIEATCPSSTTTVGIQLRGDDNDGHARISVDGATVWQGNTYGHGNGGLLFVNYLEIDGLAADSHIVRVEATGIPGKFGGNVHVAVVGFVCSRAQDVAGVKVYLPAINS